VAVAAREPAIGIGQRQGPGAARSDDDGVDRLDPARRDAPEPVPLVVEPPGEPIGEGISRTEAGDAQTPGR
jgi:hypothetical protein